MRKIKFRVFDKREKVMHVVGDDTHDSLFVGLENELMYYNLQNGEGSGEEGDYTLMEYTGFKDNDETEIYEEDILEGLFPFTEIDGTDKVGRAKGKVFFDEEIGTWKVKSSGYTDDLCDWMHEGHTKIIGNIYETPGMFEED